MTPEPAESWNQIQLSQAKTTLIIPIHWLGNGVSDMPAFLAHLRARNLPGLRERSQGIPPIWAHQKPSSNPRFKELVPSLRRLVLDDGAADDPRTQVQRLLLDDEVCKTFFGQLIVIRRKKEIASAAVDKVRLWTLVHGDALLLIDLNWITTGPITTRELSDALSELRHMGSSRVCFDGARGQGGGALPPEREDFLGSKLRGARYESRPVSIEAWANWLLATSTESADDPVKRTADTRFNHHVTGALCANDQDDPPELQVARHAVAYLRRAYQSNYQLVVDDGSQPDAGPTRDKLLQPRTNRLIGVSREGVICLNWRVVGDQPDVEKGFHENFVKFYGTLALLVLADHRTLHTLSEELASLLGEIRDLRDLPKHKRTMSSIMVKTVRYTVHLSGTDCGGPTEYVDFFRAMQDVHDIPATREELRHEVEELEGIISAGYQRRIDRLANVGVPLGVAGGLLGMNIAIFGEKSYAFPLEVGFGVFFVVSGLWWVMGKV